MVDMENIIIRKQIFIAGNVTGIGLRRKTVEYAEKIGVSGWISNNQDWRSVTIEMQGTEKQIQELQDYICNLHNIRIKELREKEILVEESDAGFGSY